MISSQVYDTVSSWQLYTCGSFPSQLMHKLHYHIDYHCGSDQGWSDLFYFTARRADVDWSPWIALFGDMGSENGQSIPRLQQEVAKHTVDMILHIGDFAYDLNSVRPPLISVISTP